jgi:hypothetical protein
LNNLSYSFLISLPFFFSFFILVSTFMKCQKNESMAEIWISNLMQE